MVSSGGRAKSGLSFVTSSIVYMQWGLLKDSEEKRLGNRMQGTWCGGLLWGVTNSEKSKTTMVGGCSGVERKIMSPEIMEKVFEYLRMWSD